MKALRLMIGFTMLMTCGSVVYSAEEAQAPQIDPAMAAKMEQMKALTSPTEAHKVLDAFVGKWIYAGKFQMTPDALPQDMIGAQENTIIFDGRFLKQEIVGPWMGSTFHGLGYTGFDNVKGEYVSVWFDDMGTGIMTVSGSYDAATKTLAQSGTNSCPLTGEKARPGRSTWTVVDHDHTTYASYMNGPDGKEFKMMEINYTRVS